MLTSTHNSRTSMRLSIPQTRRLVLLVVVLRVGLTYVPTRYIHQMIPTQAHRAWYNVGKPPQRTLDVFLFLAKSVDLEISAPNASGGDLVSNISRPFTIHLKASTQLTKIRIS